ncbi:hypothetical protein EBR96_07190 [bacterium]|nr:hypothetical protein [bacterium]
MQPSYRNIWDSVDMATLGSNPSTATFFQNSQGKQYPFTNWNNQLTEGECICIENITFYVGLVTSGRLTGYQPLENAAPSIIASGSFDVVLSSSQVIKQMHLTNQVANFNPSAKFAAIRTGATAADTVLFGDSVMEIDSMPIILPNYPIAINLQTTGIPTPPSAGTQFLFCRISGLGTVAAPAKL